jgi:hypothetical protein
MVESWEKKEKRDGNTEVTEIGTQSSQRTARGREQRTQRREKRRKSKSEIRKTGRVPRRDDIATIPPLRNGKRRRCSGRDDNWGDVAKSAALRSG